MCGSHQCEWNRRWFILRAVRRQMIIFANRNFGQCESSGKEARNRLRESVQTARGRALARREEAVRAEESGAEDCSAAGAASDGLAPILAAPTNTAPLSITRLRASISPKKRAVARNRTVPVEWTVLTSSPPMSAPPIL